MLRTFKFHCLFVALAAGITGCSNVELVGKAKVLEVTGTYCTTDAEDYDVPINVLLCVDTSESNKLTDKTDGRMKAAAALIDHLFSDPNRNVKMAICEFNTGATDVTNGFQADPALLKQALPNLQKKEGFTNYIGALTLMRNMVKKELSKIAEEIRRAKAEGKRTDLMRPAFVLLWLSDGIPRDANAEVQTPEAIEFEQKLLLEVSEEARSIVMHTAFLGSPDGKPNPQAEKLLKGMAEDGRGSYFRFPNGDAIDFRLFDFSVKRLFEIKQFFAYNRQAIFDQYRFVADSDGDGLADYLELEWKTDPAKADTDDDGLSDGFEVLTANDPVTSNGACGTDEIAVDDDADNLNMCSENIINGNDKRFDADGDTFPDGFEFFSGTNPGNGADIETDIDFDDALALDELRWRTDPSLDERDVRERFAYRYNLARDFDAAKGKVCYNFSVSNISLLQTIAVGDKPAGYNEIVLEFVTSPQDDPVKVSTLNRLIVPVNRDDAGEKISLSADQAKFIQVSRQELPRD
ncbi:MAG: VWA domain-containing protein [Deltaproteobacteria bacterium]|nr:VWA domain-containing protein [Deltaproteobacteria bacterium]